MKMTKIAEHNIQPYGKRGVALSLPRVYANDNKLEKGSSLMIFRTQVNGVDALVLIPKDKEQLLEKTEPLKEGVAV